METGISNYCYLGFFGDVHLPSLNTIMFDVFTKCLFPNTNPFKDNSPNGTVKRLSLGERVKMEHT